MPQLNKAAATLFERFVYSPPMLVDLQTFESKVKRIGDYPCRSHHFYSSTLQTNFRINKFYFAYRWVICAIYFTSCLILSTDPTNSEAKTENWYYKYPIYFSNITITLGWFQTLMGGVIITMGIRSYGFNTDVPIDEDIQNHQQIYWKLHQLSVLASLSVSMTFWLVINPKHHRNVNLNNIWSHGINSVLALSDWLITGLPYNFTDYWVPVAYTFSYFIFTYLYWEAGGLPRLKPGTSASDVRVIYPKCTDWDHPDIAFLCYFICLTHTALLHVLLCALNKLRVKLMLKTPLPQLPDTSRDRLNRSKTNLTSYEEITT